MKTIPYLMLGLGAGLVSVGAWMWWQEGTPPPSVFLVESNLNVGGIPLDKAVEITFRVTNTSSKPQRIVGVLDEPC